MYDPIHHKGFVVCFDHSANEWYVVTPDGKYNSNLRGEDPTFLVEVIDAIVLRQTRPDIGLTTIRMMGDRFGPDQTIVVENIGGERGSRNYIKLQAFFKQNARHMQLTLIGRSYPVYCITRSRVDAFIAHAAKSGLRAAWWSHEDEQEWQSRNPITKAA